MTGHSVGNHQAKLKGPARMKRTGSIGIVMVMVVLNAAGARAGTVRETYPNLVHGMLAAAKLAELPEGVVLRCTELDITQADLDRILAESAASLREQLRRNSVYLLDELATKKVLLAAARQEAAKAQKSLAGKNDTQIVNEYADGIAAGLAVSDDEVARFYEQNTEMFGGASLKKVRDSLKAYLLQDKRREALQKHVSALAERFQVAVSAPWVAEHAALAHDNPVDKARASGLPSMVDFGADGCTPCERMKPILEALKQKYAGKANIVFVHARNEIVLSTRYGIQSIPTQFFFDKNGKEVFRHTGYYSQREIEAKLKEMGVQ